MEARALPQKNILEVIENIQQKVWSEIETKIIDFTRQLIEELLEEKVKQLIGAERYRRQATSIEAAIGCLFFSRYPQSSNCRKSLASAFL